MTRSMDAAFNVSSAGQLESRSVGTRQIGVNHRGQCVSCILPAGLRLQELGLGNVGTIEETRFNGASLMNRNHYYYCC